jgi:hypothetical protein
MLSNACVYSKIVYNYLMASSLTVKIKVAFGGMTGGEPFLPYANAAGMVNLRSPPTCNPATPISQPLITSPRPRAKVNGDPETFLSKT